MRSAGGTGRIQDKTSNLNLQQLTVDGSMRSLAWEGGSGGGGTALVSRQTLFTHPEHHVVRPKVADAPGAPRLEQPQPLLRRVRVVHVRELVEPVYQTDHVVYAV